MPIARTSLDNKDASIFGEVSRQTIREVIAEKLATLIASGVLSVGEELPSERELAATLSVSRETVRSAIQTLASHGILKVAHGARTTVVKADLGSFSIQGSNQRSIEKYDLESVHTSRLLIEHNVITEAAQRISAQTIEHLRRSLDVQSTCLNDPVRFLMCDREFHVLIYQSCGNPLLADICTNLYNYLLDHRRLIVARPQAISTSIKEHHSIFSALEQHDAEKAAAAFGAHEMRIYLTTNDLLNGGVVK